MVDRANRLAEAPMADRRAKSMRLQLEMQFRLLLAGLIARLND
jgi:hypothetical protein